MPIFYLIILINSSKARFPSVLSTVGNKARFVPLRPKYWKVSGAALSSYFSPERDMRPGIQNLPLGCYLPPRCHSWKHSRFSSPWGLCQHPEPRAPNGRGWDRAWLRAQQLLQLPKNCKGGFWSPEGPPRVLGFMKPWEAHHSAVRSPQHLRSSGKMRSIGDPQRGPAWPRVCKPLSQPSPAPSAGRQIGRKYCEEVQLDELPVPRRCEATAASCLAIIVRISWQDPSHRAESLKSFRIPVGSQTLFCFVYSVIVGVLC